MSPRQDVNNRSFENKAFVQHKSGLLSGYVRVTATFEPAKGKDDELPNSRINVNFQKRFIAISKIAGFKTKFFEPVKVVSARNPQDRTFAQPNRHFFKMIYPAINEKWY